jgi:hypothetical protein
MSEQRIPFSDVVMPVGWALEPDGSAVKEVRDEHGAVVARLTTDNVFMPPIVMPLPRRHK